MIRNAEQKIVTLEELITVRKRLRREHKKLVWTNGCFDLLHLGHVRYLECARRSGDCLVVGINSDESYRRYKRKPGPVQPEEERIRIVAALECVDYALLFDAPSPVELLRVLQPDVFVKGTDYSMVTIDSLEKETVLAYGGEVRLCPGVPNLSTSRLIERILRLHSPPPDR